MKKLLLVALTGVLLLPALPGAAQLPGTDPSPTPTPTPTATATPTADPAATGPTLTYAGRGITRSIGGELGGNALAFGITSSRTANGATDECEGIACATAAAAVEPFGEQASATSPGNPGPNEVQAFDVGEDADPQLEQLLAATVGAATAQTSDQPSAAGTANGATIDLVLTQTVVDNLPPELTEGLQDGISQIVEGLEPVAEGDPTGVIGGLTETLDGLLADLSASPLFRLQLGESASTSDFAEGTVSARAQAAGAILTILPTPESTPLVPQGLAIIEVTPSFAEASADGTNEATANAEGSIARITLLPGVLDGLGLEPGESEGLPLDEILDQLPPELTDLLPGEITDLLGGGGDEEPTDEPTEGEPTEGEPTEGEPTEDEGATGTPIDDILPTFMQADEASGGFVIDLTTGSEQTCIAEGTPVETCVTVGGTSTNFSEDRLSVGVLAAGVDVSAFRAEGVGQLEIGIGRSEAGAAAAFVQAPAPTPEVSPQTALPQTGATATVVLPALLLMGLSAAALVGVRRGRES